MPNRCARSVLLLPLRLFSFHVPSLSLFLPPSPREVILRPRNNSERKLAQGNEIYSSGLRAGELTTTPARALGIHRRQLPQTPWSVPSRRLFSRSPSREHARDHPLFFLIPLPSPSTSRRRFPAISRKSLETPRHFVPHCLTCALTTLSAQNQPNILLRDRTPGPSLVYDGGLLESTCTRLTLSSFRGASYEAVRARCGGTSVSFPIFLCPTRATSIARCRSFLYLSFSLSLFHSLFFEHT